ncbi:hypothetical protein [uncultured Aquimarina sp.]|uniref:hypothetical protein n=1 Tax=uncultured Aquimarina sp. TaxID=575652 RepID=UPI00262D67E0|nr:hypothetical protein [uncultured Aquimarina sp.]
MYLSQFIDTIQPRNVVIPTFSMLSTKTSHRFQNFFNNESRTASNLATVLWHIISYCPKYTSILVNSRNYKRNPFPKKEQYIINNKGKYNLLVFDSKFKQETPLLIPVELTRNEAKQGYIKWKKATQKIVKSTNLKTRSTSEIYGRLANQVDENFAYDMLKNYPLDIIIASKESQLNLTAGYTSSSPMGISLTANGKQTSTAGAIATDVNGDLGVTVSYHSIEDSQGQIPIGKNIWVDGKKATITSVDIISDSCFATYNNQNIQIPNVIIGLKGPLSGQSPRQYDSVDFYGLKSGSKNSIVQGWSMEIPFVQPYTQLKVITDPDTNPGDSGAALIDSDDHIIGFAFYRTGVGARVRYSTWIWADSVFKAHNII